MAKLDPFEAEIVEAYEAGRLESVASSVELERLKTAARATAIKDRRVNIRLSAGDLQDIQVKALQEGMPYQTLIASVLHKYVTGRLVEEKLGNHSVTTAAAEASEDSATENDS